MRAAFFRRGDGGELEFIAYAKTSKPVQEFKLLVSGDIGHPSVFKAYGNTTPPTLDSQCVLGMGRTKDEAANHIVFDANDI